MRKAILLLAVTGILAGCGKVSTLRPAAGGTLPPAPYGAREKPDAAALLAVPVQARPGVSDELLNQSQRRPDDPFELPPGEPVPATDPVTGTDLAKPDPADTVETGTPK